MSRRMIFATRAQAGQLLAERLSALELSHPVVLALPRGGVPVAAEIARRLRAPLDVALVRKIGAPGQPELAIGAVADGSSPEIVVNTALLGELALDEDYVRGQGQRELALIEERRRSYAALAAPVAIAGRAAIVVDDGAATGMTMLTALRYLRREDPAQRVAALPVASREALAMLRAEADVVVCLSSPRRFRSVGAFYRSFAQVSDAEVEAALKDLHGVAT